MFIHQQGLAELRNFHAEALNRTKEVHDDGYYAGFSDRCVELLKGEDIDQILDSSVREFIFALEDEHRAESKVMHIFMSISDNKRNPPH